MANYLALQPLKVKQNFQDEGSDGTKITRHDVK